MVMLHHHFHLPKTMILEYLTGITWITLCKLREDRSCLDSKVQSNLLLHNAVRDSEWQRVNQIMSMAIVHLQISNAMIYEGEQAISRIAPMLHHTQAQGPFLDLARHCLLHHRLLMMLVMTQGKTLWLQQVTLPN